GERIAWIARIDPIAIGKLAIQGEYEALRAICLPPIIAGTIIGGQCWYEAAGETGCHSGDHAISHPVPLVGANLPTSVIQRLNLLYAGAKQDFSSRLANALYQPVVELLKAATQVAKV